MYKDSACQKFCQRGLYSLAEIEWILPQAHLHALPDDILPTAGFLCKPTFRILSAETKLREAKGRAVIGRCGGLQHKDLGCNYAMTMTFTSVCRGILARAGFPELVSPSTTESNSDSGERPLDNEQRRYFCSVTGFWPWYTLSNNLLGAFGSEPG